MAVTPEQLEQVSAGLKAHVGNLLGLTSKKVDDLDGKLANGLDRARRDRRADQSSFGSHGNSP